MSVIREEVVRRANSRAYALIDFNIYNNIHKQFEFKQQTVLADKSLTEDEKTEAIRKLRQYYDRDKILFNEGTKRVCENCNQECLATLYCEYCIRNYLKENFSNWTSGNNDIDNLIQKCQLETIRPSKIVEWIPYNNLQNIKYLTKGGCSEIYIASWIDGCYEEWDSKNQQLKRSGRINIILKKLESANHKRWFEEIQSHLTLSNKCSRVVKSYGLTQDLSNGNYMLVMNKMDMDLKKYLQQNQLTWKKRIQIAVDIIDALSRIHGEDEVHRDLHSGNILYLQSKRKFRISDFGFCGPIDKPLNGVYGNLSYVAPEVISGKGTTKASDIYSIAILMWEISSGQPPFINHENDFYLAMNIINGMRPKIVSGTPSEYNSLMKQCWDVDPLKRPDIYALRRKIREINLYYQNQNEAIQSEIKKNNDLEINKINSSKTNYTSGRIFISKVYQFENCPEPRSATEEEQEAFHSKPYDFDIPDNIDDLNNQKKNNALIQQQIYVNHVVIK